MSVNSIMSNTFAVVQSPQRSFQTMCLVCSFTPYSKKSWRFDSGLHKCRNSPGKNPSLKLHGFMVMFMGLELRVDSYKRPLKMADFKAKGWFCKAPYVNLAVLKEHGASRCRPVVLRDTHLLPAQAFLPPPPPLPAPEAARTAGAVLLPACPLTPHGTACPCGWLVPESLVLAIIGRGQLMFRDRF